MSVVMVGAKVAYVAEAYMCDNVASAFHSGAL